jgi:hypothetical protein
MNRFTRRLMSLGLSAAALLLIGPAYSHHSFAAHYDLDHEVRFEAVVTDYQFINPHVLIFFDTQSGDGVSEAWVAETNSPSLFRRRGRGLKRDSFKPGDEITIAGHPSRFNDNDMHINLIIFPNGEEFRSGNAQAQGR